MNTLAIGAALAVLALIGFLHFRRKHRERADRLDAGPAVRREGVEDAGGDGGSLVPREPDWRNLDSPYDFVVRSPGKADPDDMPIEIYAPGSPRQPLPDDYTIPDFLRRS